MARLAHPGCVRVHGFGTDERFGSYLVMDLVEGRPPDRVLRVGETPELLLFARRVAEVLGYLHSNDVVHGDLKPDNICCIAGDPTRPVLLDFGLAAVSGKAEHGGGTPRYMAPELLRGAHADARSDLYALGVVLYELVAGRPPFPRKTAVEVMRAHMDEAPRPLAQCAPDARLDLCSLVDSLLQKEPGGRPATAYEVLARLTELAGEGLEEPPPSADAGQTVGSPALVSRDEALQAFDRMLSDAAEGTGGLMVVHGPPGSGRSRVLGEIGIRARLAGADVRSCHGAARTAGDSTSSLLRALGDSDPADTLEEALFSPLHGASRSTAERAFDRATRLLEGICASGPLVLLCDDVARGSSDARLVRGLSATLRGLRCVVVVGTDTEGGAELSGVADASSPLEPLRLGDISRLMRGALGDIDQREPLAAWLLAQSGGSVADALEGIRWLVESGTLRRRAGRWFATRELSVASQDLWRAGTCAASYRTRSLSRANRRTLEVAALLGDPFDPEFLESVTGGAVDDVRLARLVSARLLAWAAGDRSRLTFARRSVRAALLEEMTPERRRELHARLALALRNRVEEGVPAGVSIGRLASHMIGSGDIDEGVPLLLLALDDLRNRGAHDAARRLVDGAIEEIELLGLGREHLPALLLRLGDLWMDVDEPESALRAFTTAREQADPADVPRLLGREGGALTRLGRYPEAIGALSETLDQSGTSADEAFAAAFDLAWCHMMSGAFEEALDAAELSHHLARATGLPSREARALRLRGTILWRTGNAEAALRTNLEALERFGASGDAVEAAFTWLEVGNAHRILAQYEEAQSAYREALERFERAGHRRGIGKCRNNLGVVHYYLGDWAEATACFEAFLQVVDRTGEQAERVCLLNNLGTLYRDRGHLARAIETLQRGRELATELGATRLRAMIVGNLGEAVMLTGRKARAYELLQEARALSEQVGADDELLETDRRMLACTLTAGLGPSDRRRTEELLERATIAKHALEQGNLCAMLADILRRSGLPDDARAVAERGLRAVLPTGAALETARLRTRLAEAMLDAGDPVAAREEARTAELVFGRLGATPDRATVTALLRCIGDAPGRAPEPTSVSWDGTTNPGEPMPAAVVDLLARGGHRVDSAIPTDEQTVRVGPARGSARRHG